MRVGGLGLCFLRPTGARKSPLASRTFWLGEPTFLLFSVSTRRHVRRKCAAARSPRLAYAPVRTACCVSVGLLVSISESLARPSSVACTLVPCTGYIPGPTRINSADPACLSVYLHRLDPWTRALRHRCGFPYLTFRARHPAPLVYPSISLAYQSLHLALSNPLLLTLLPRRCRLTVVLNMDPAPTTTRSAVIPGARLCSFIALVKRKKRHKCMILESP